MQMVIPIQNTLTAFWTVHDLDTKSKSKKEYSKVGLVGDKLCGLKLWIWSTR